MERSISIREMSEADRPLWLGFYKGLFPSHAEAGMQIEIDQILASPKRSAYVAFEGDIPAGFAEYALRDYANGCNSKPVPFLEGIFVRPEFRGRGVARAMMAFLEDMARKQGYLEFGSDVDMENQASLDMHDALGFEETERVVYFRKDL